MTKNGNTAYRTPKDTPARTAWRGIIRAVLSAGVQDMSEIQGATGLPLTTLWHILDGKIGPKAETCRALLPWFRKLVRDGLIAPTEEGEGGDKEGGEGDSPYQSPGVTTDDGQEKA